MGSKWAAFLAAATLGSAANAEVVSATPDHMTLSQTYESALAPADLWAKMLKPSKWWGDAHTYSGNAGNLALHPVPGGLWLETWDGGTIAHGEVLTVTGPDANGTYLLRMSAPFGPMQGMAVSTALTLEIAPAGAGSSLRMGFVANGSDASGLDGLATAVDGVWASALTSLVGN